MKRFTWKIIICLVPLIVAALVVANAFTNYWAGKGGFKLGVDLVGGTILIYEIDEEKLPKDQPWTTVQAQQLATRLKSRIDPGDLFNITVRVASDKRFEIILPTGGQHQVAAQDAAWRKILADVEQEFPLKNPRYAVAVGAREELEKQIKLAYPKADSKDIAKLISDTYPFEKTDTPPTEEQKKAWRALLAAVNKEYAAPLPQYTTPVGHKMELLAEVNAQHSDKKDLEDIRKFIADNYNDKTPSAEQAKAWKTLLKKISEAYPLEHYEVGRGKVTELGHEVLTYYPDAELKEITQLVNPNQGASSAGPRRRGKRGQSMTTEQVQERKELISQVGSLEFKILCNKAVDGDALDAGEKYFQDAKKNPEKQKELEDLAFQGKPPPPPLTANGDKFFETKQGRYSYSWVELGPEYRWEHGFLDPRDKRTGAVLNMPEPPRGNKEDPKYEELAQWERTKGAAYKEAIEETVRVGQEYRRKYDGFLKALQARERGDLIIDYSGTWLYSRICTNPRLPEKDRDKSVEYFLLTRDAEVGTEPITGRFVSSASQLDGSVGFRMKAEGAPLFREFTSKNKGQLMSIVLDGYIESVATIQSAISESGQITGNFTQDRVDALVKVLRSGSLPATLKPEPVSESTMGPTLGADTIFWGAWSVLGAFAAVLLFMLVYYRFAGLVACVALMANLLLTVAFMVAIDATFTLPGLAGLVLMLGMAVDANVLIYERLREERERNVGLSQAIRNGYDHALPTIIDTHLSSIFTAIVLYVVGNDQLKGFGISLTVGLIISLFTSLYMTRTMFDFWQAKGWLQKLSMMRLFAKPNIDFMAIRYYWFTATVILTIIGAMVFIYRLDRGGLNIDFVGGTAYAGELTNPASIEDLRKALDKTALPDLSVEQIFISAEGYTQGSKSKLFTVRTSDKDVKVVQSKINEALSGKDSGPELKRVYLTDFKVVSDNKEYPADEARKLAETREVELAFTADPQGTTPTFASRAQVSMLLTRELKEHGLEKASEQMNLDGVGKDQEGRFQWMVAKFYDPIKKEDLAKLVDALKATQKTFSDSPLPERLENFDSQLAQETQLRALYAILASWGAILLYLWFRFGNWTFGAAAVLCLIHDLFFTLGIIAFCHYIYTDFPGVASALMIQDFKIDLPTVAALLTLVGYSTNDTIVVFDRIREVRGKNPALTPETINASVNQTLSRTVLASLATWLVVIVLYIMGGEGVHLFAFVMVVGVIVGTYSSIYIASPLLLIFGEGRPSAEQRDRAPQPQPAESKA